MPDLRYGIADWCRICPVLATLIVLCVTGAHAATEPLIIDATAHTFHWVEDYESGLSPAGPAFEVGNLSLHLTPGRYGDDERQPAKVAVYDSTPDRSRVFMATGYKFEASVCGSKFLVLNWTGTMGDQQLTLIELELSQDEGQWRIAKVTMTRHGTRWNSTIRDVAPWAETCEDLRSDR